MQACLPLTSKQTAREAADLIETSSRSAHWRPRSKSSASTTYYPTREVQCRDERTNFNDNPGDEYGIHSPCLAGTTAERHGQGGRYSHILGRPSCLA